MVTVRSILRYICPEHHFLKSNRTRDFELNFKIYSFFLHSFCYTSFLSIIKSILNIFHVTTIIILSYRELKQWNACIYNWTRILHRNN